MATPTKRTPPPPAAQPPAPTPPTPPAKKKPAAAPPPAPEPVEEAVHDEAVDTANVDWQGLLDSMATSGPVFYPKQGRTNLRLLPPMTKNVFVPVTAWYQGQARTKYIVAAWGKDLGTNGEPAIRAVLMPKRTVQGILSMQVEGWDLFDPARGYPIALVKAANQTSVLVAPKPVRIPDDVLEEYEEFDILKIAEDWSAFQEKRAKNPNGAIGSGSTEGTGEEKEAPAEDW